MSRTLRFSSLSLGVLALCGCAPNISPTQAPAPRLSSPQAPLGKVGASTPSGAKPSSWIVQAWQGWQRAQNSPAQIVAPARRFRFGAPTPVPAPFLVSLSPELATSPGSISPLLGFDGGSFGTSLSPLPPATFVSGADLWARALAIPSGAGSNRGAGARAAVSDWSALQRRMEARQIASLQSRALRLAGLRENARGDEERLLRADLQLDIDRLGRLDLDALVPAATEVEAERLRDLRLQLLSALALAPGQKLAAQDERLRIETEIRTLLREQELARRGLIQRLQREVPAQIQLQRGQQIERALLLLQESDARSITRLLDEQRRRVRRDFDAPARLGIASAPAASTPQISFNANYLRTFSGTGSSLAPVARPQAPSQSGSVRLAGAQSASPIADREAAERAVVGNGASAAMWRDLLRKRERAWQSPVR